MQWRMESCVAPETSSGVRDTWSFVTHTARRLLAIQQDKTTYMTEASSILRGSHMGRGLQAETGLEVNRRRPLLVN